MTEPLIFRNPRPYAEGAFRSVNLTETGKKGVTTFLAPIFPAKQQENYAIIEAFLEKNSS